MQFAQLVSHTSLIISLQIHQQVGVLRLKLRLRRTLLRQSPGKESGCGECVQVTTFSLCWLIAVMLQEPGIPGVDRQGQQRGQEMGDPGKQRPRDVGRGGRGPLRAGGLRPRAGGRDGGCDGADATAATPLTIVMTDLRPPQPNADLLIFSRSSQ